MRKVLMIANQFPPMGGAGVQRTSKFVKYLTQLGHEVAVITKEVEGGLKDKTLNEDIPDSVKVYRLKVYDFTNGTGFLGLVKKVLSKLVSPDSEIFWAKKNEKEVLNLLDKERPEILYTTSFPYSSHLLGLYIKKLRPDIKWIVDYRDEWTNNPFHLDSRLNRLKFKSEKKEELEINEACDFLIANTEIMLANFVKDTPSLEGRSTFIPNGYDESDFEGLDIKGSPEDTFVMTHTGSLYGRRNLDDVVEAIKLLLDRGEVEKEKIELRIVGNVYESVLDKYRQDYDLRDEIVSYGYLPHKKSIEMLFQSDALLLLIGKGKGSGNFYTGKVFEYLRTYKPIIGIVPDGVARDLIIDTGTGLTADPGDIEGIAGLIKKFYGSKFSGEEVIEPVIDQIEKYRRENQAKALSKIIEEI